MTSKQNELEDHSASMNSSAHGKLLDYSKHRASAATAKAVDSDASSSSESLSKLTVQRPKGHSNEKLRPPADKSKYTEERKPDTISQLGSISNHQHTTLNIPRISSSHSRNSQRTHRVPNHSSQKLIPKNSKSLVESISNHGVIGLDDSSNHSHSHSHSRRISKHTSQAAVAQSTGRILDGKKTFTTSNDSKGSSLASISNHGIIGVDDSSNRSCSRSRSRRISNHVNQDAIAQASTHSTDSILDGKRMSGTSNHGKGTSDGCPQKKRGQPSRQQLKDAVSTAEYLLSLPMDGNESYHGVAASSGAVVTLNNKSNAATDPHQSSPIRSSPVQMKRPTSLGNSRLSSNRSSLKYKAKASISTMTASSISLNFGLDDYDDDDSDSSAEFENDHHRSQLEPEPILKESCSNRLRLSFSNLLAAKKVASPKPDRSISPAPRRGRRRRAHGVGQQRLRSSSESLTLRRQPSLGASCDSDDGSVVSCNRSINSLIPETFKDVSLQSAHDETTEPPACVNFSIRRVASCAGIARNGNKTDGNEPDKNVSSHARLKRSLTDMKKLAALAKDLKPGEGGDGGRPQRLPIKRTKSVGSVPLGVGALQVGAPVRMSPAGQEQVRHSRHSRLKEDREHSRGSPPTTDRDECKNIQPKLGRSSTDGASRKMLWNVPQDGQPSRVYSLVVPKSDSAGDDNLAASSHSTSSTNQDSQQQIRRGNRRASTRGLSKQLNAAMKINVSDRDQQQQLQISKRNSDGGQQKGPNCFNVRRVASTGGSRLLHNSKGICSRKHSSNVQFLEPSNAMPEGSSLVSGGSAKNAQWSSRKPQNELTAPKHLSDRNRAAPVSGQAGSSLSHLDSQKATNMRMGPKSTGRLVLDHTEARKTERRSAQLQPLMPAGTWDLATLKGNQPTGNVVHQTKKKPTDVQTTPRRNAQCGEKAQQTVLKRNMSRADSGSKLAMFAAMSRKISQESTADKKNAQWGTQSQQPATITKTSSSSKMAMLVTKDRQHATNSSLKQRTASTGNLLSQAKALRKTSPQSLSLGAGLKPATSHAMMPGLDHVMSGLAPKPGSPSRDNENTKWKSARELSSSPRPFVTSPMASNARVSRSGRIGRSTMPVVETSERSLSKSSRRSVSRTSSSGASLKFPGPLSRVTRATSTGNPVSRLSQLMGADPGTQETVGTRGLSRSASGKASISRTTSGKGLTNALDRLERMSGAPARASGPSSTRGFSSRNSRGSRLNLAGGDDDDNNNAAASNRFVTGSRIRRFNSTGKLSLAMNLR